MRTVTRDLRSVMQRLERSSEICRVFAERAALEDVANGG
jgi:hypothetical protein